MCGIAGYFNLNLGTDSQQQILQCMCDSITHRGPDDEGFYADEIAGIGMRRLSIIDLEGGHQPIPNEDATKHIVYNGEVYNYGDLRPSLIQKGHQFTTESDTEVILHLYEEYGKACVDKLNGMFTFAIWDSAKRELFIARDRMGIKPLYYYWDGQRLIFASEIKAILATGLVSNQINPQAIWHYLTFRYVPQPMTIWQNIYKLPPAHTLSISFDQPQPTIERYWDIHYETSQIKSASDYLAEFEALFLDAVRLRLIADVPVGILLSGGLDSSAVAAAISLVHNAPLNSYSVSFADSPQTDELPFAHQVSAHVGTNHHEVVIGQKEFMDFLPRFVHFSDEPLADLASIPLHYVSALARQDVKVVLSGEGSDEILGGYGFDKYMQLVPRMNQRASLYTTLAKFISPFHSATADKLRNRVLPAHQENHRNPRNMTNFMTESQKQHLWGNGDTSTFNASIAMLQDEVARSNTDNPLHQTLYLYAQSWLVEDLLMKADKMTMANSLELRVPFLDHRLVEWAAQSPDWVKVKQDNNGDYSTKWALRQFSQKHLPETIINRPKMGFPVPVYEWLSGDLKSWVNDTLANAHIYQWLNRDHVQQLVKQGTSPQATTPDKHILWNLLILETWLQEWQPA